MIRKLVGVIKIEQYQGDRPAIKLWGT
jgi:hypothetical protein